MAARLLLVLLCILIGCSTPPAQTASPSPDLGSPSPDVVASTPTLTVPDRVVVAEKPSEPETAVRPDEGDGGPNQFRKARLITSKRPQTSSKADQRLVKALLDHDRVLTETTQSKAFVAAIQKLAEERKYERLEQLATRYRKDRSNLDDGSRKSVIMYFALKTPRQEDRAGWLPLRLHEWLQARPNSVAVRVALARMLMEVDEGRWGNTELAEQKWLRAYLDNPLSYSRKYLEEASRLSHGDPDIYALLIDQVRHEGGSLEEGEKYLRAGQKLDPTSYHLQGQYARLLQARGRNWRDAVERPEDLLYIQRYLPKLRVPKDFALECYQQTATSHPRSTYVRNALAKAAMDAKEFDLAAEAFSQLGDRVELYVWRPREFYRQRNRLIEMGYQVDTKTFAPLPSLPPECAGVDIDQDLLSIQVSELFSGEFYPELDAVAGVYRAKKTRFVNFDSKLGTLYAALESEKLSDLALWERSVLFERWRKLCPDSPTAATGSVSTAISEAWEVRGGGYADSVSKKQWEGFSERLQMADSYFQAAIRSGKPTDGFLYAHAITIGMGTSAPREVVEHWLDEARAIDPWEPAPFDAMYNYLLPRWHGSPSAVKKFLGGLKPPMFAMVACKDIEDSEMSREQAIERIAAGFVHLAKAHPSRENWSRALFFATGCANQDLARTCFANLQGNWSAEWVSCQNHYDRLKRKAYQGTE